MEASADRSEFHDEVVEGKNECRKALVNELAGG